jgi:hypothetical protein
MPMVNRLAVPLLHRNDKKGASAPENSDLIHFFFIHCHLPPFQTAPVEGDP